MDIVGEPAVPIDDTSADYQTDGELIWLISQTDDVDTAA